LRPDKLSKDFPLIIGFPVSTSRGTSVGIGAGVDVSDEVAGVEVGNGVVKDELGVAAAEFAEGVEFN
jgi:hypothetical protein